MTRMMVALLMGVALAGCFGSQGDDADQDDGCEDLALCDIEAHFKSHYCVKHDVHPRVYAPDTPSPGLPADPWTKGDWWEFRLVVDGKDHGKTKLVYYDIQDNGAHYMVGTPTREEALQHAIFSVNPVIGRVHKTLYSPHESGAHADMFFFPLCQGSTWADRFFGTTFNFEARQTSLALPGGTTDGSGFTITGTAGASRVTHTYSPDVKWFTKIDLDRKGSDPLDVDMTLTGFGSGAKGDAFFLRGQQDEVVTLDGLTASKTWPIERSDGSAGPYDTIGIAIHVERTQGQGMIEVRVKDPQGNLRQCTGVQGSGVGGLTPCATGDVMAEEDYVAGTWQVELVMPALGDTKAKGEVRLVNIYDRSGRV